MAKTSKVTAKHISTGVVREFSPLAWAKLSKVKIGDKYYAKQGYVTTSGETKAKVADVATPPEAVVSEGGETKAKAAKKQ